jgi:hypothetical protein
MSNEQDDKDWRVMCKLTDQLRKTIQRAHARSADDLTPAQVIAALMYTIDGVLEQSCPDCARDLGERAQGHLAHIVKKIEAAGDEECGAGRLH